MSNTLRLIEPQVKNSMRLDPTDRKILLALRDDARLPLARLADRLGVATSTVHHRVRRLTEEGFIRGARLDFDWDLVGLPMTAAVSLALGNSLPKAEAAALVEKVDHVETCHSISGEFDLMCMVRARAPEHLEEVIDEMRGVVPVSAIRTVVVLTTYFEGRMPPLPEVRP